VNTTSQDQTSQDQDQGPVNCNQAQSEYKHSLTFRVRRYVVIATNKTRASIANPPNSAQLEGTPVPFAQVTSGSVQ